MTLPLTVATVRPSVGRHSTAGGRRATRGAALLLAASSGWGCNVQCAGPGCETSWPAARLSVVRGVPSAQEVELLAADEGSFAGTLDEGAGWSVTTVGGAIVLGQPTADRVVRLADRTTDGGVDPVARWTADAGVSFGASVGAARSNAAEGAWDLWVGAPADDFDKGAAVLFRRADLDAARDRSSADLTLVGTTPGDQLGSALTVCADVTGDRQPDVVVTAPWFADPESGLGLDATVPALAGGVFLLRSDDLAGATGRTPIFELATTWFGSAPGEGAGAAVVCDRDLDGDGLVDLVVGAPWADGSRGRVYVLSGGDLPSGRLDEVATSVLDGFEGGEWFGSSLATLQVAGDPVLVVGAAGYRNGAGRVHLLSGSQLAAADPTQLATFEPSITRIAADHFGRSAHAADLDGDLRDDLIVGAPDFHGSGRNDFDTGRLWVWLGSSSERWIVGAFADDAEHVFAGTQPFQRIGRAVAVADLDADGVDDLLVPTRAADPDAER